MLLSALAGEIQAQFYGRDAEYFSVSTDTRCLRADDLFVALRGERFDAHDYVFQALDQGALAVVVDRAWFDAHPSDVVGNAAGAFLVTENTRIAFGGIAKAWRAQFTAKRIALTGSCGKTTVKELLASILRHVGSTLATQGNLNNDIGVPLTLLQLRNEHQFLVAELGTSHQGEIAYTTALVNPEIALVNNVGPAHLAGFGSVQNIAREKGAIYQGLMPGGTAVINLDDDFAGLFLQETQSHHRIGFSLSNTQADVYLLESGMKDSGEQWFVASVQGEPLAIELRLLGRHNLTNALAAIATAKAAGIGNRSIEIGLNDFTPSSDRLPGRLAPVADIRRHLVIDDTYNANPKSFCSAIDMLCDLSSNNCLVLGPMGELGAQSAQLHRQVGAYAGERGVPLVYSLGPEAEDYEQGYRSALPQSGRFIKAQSHEAIAKAILREEPGKTVLIKGSRTAAMERVILSMRDQLHKEQPDAALGR